MSSQRRSDSYPMIETAGFSAAERPDRLHVLVGQGGFIMSTPTLKHMLTGALSESLDLPFDCRCLSDL